MTASFRARRARHFALHLHGLFLLPVAEAAGEFAFHGVVRLAPVPTGADLLPAPAAEIARRPALELFLALRRVRHGHLPGPAAVMAGVDAAAGAMRALDLDLVFLLDRPLAAAGRARLFLGLRLVAA